MTCVVPMQEDESLADSDIWQLILHAHQDSLPGLGDGNSSGGSGGAASSTEVHPQGKEQVLLKLVDAKVAAECEGGIDFGSLRSAAAGAAERVQGRRLKVDASDLPLEDVDSALHDIPLYNKAKGKALQQGSTRQGKDLKNRPVGDTIKDAAHAAREKEQDLIDILERGTATSEPVQREGEACWVGCGNQSGSCPTGFCGGGVCCRRWRLEADCPVGLKGGCDDQHCCVARPRAATPTEVTCNAAPGFYCLASMLPEDKKRNITSAENCALQRTVQLCPPGLYCPGGKLSPRACGRGKHCPAGSASAQLCPDGYFCPISAWKEKCSAAYYCAPGSTSPELCPEGYYCPDGFRYVCPAGHFCTPGSTRPEKCAAVALCPEGSAAQDWQRAAQITFAVAVPLWLLTLQAVPRWLNRRVTGIASAVPAAMLLAVLSAAWVVNLDLISLTWSKLGLEGADLLTMERIFGLVPHMTALLFMSLTCALLGYGTLVSPRIADPAVRVAADSAALATGCLAFTLYMKDWHVGIFIGSLWGAWQVVWVLLVQKGPELFRAGLLVAGLFALWVGFLSLGTPELAHFLMVTLVAVAIKDALCELPVWYLFAWIKGGKDAEKALGAAAGEMEMPRWGLRSPTGRGSNSNVDHATTAAAVRAAARECLAAHKIRGTASDGGASLKKATDSQAWASWAAPYSGSSPGRPEHQEMDSTMDSTGAESSSSDDGTEQSLGVSFELDKVCYELESGRRLLHELSFTVPAGQVVAVMGASGSGKTTLLSMLSGRCRDNRFVGEMRLNGRSVKPHSMAELRPLIGYVPQDDVMHAALTVRENIEFQADLRLRQSPPAPARATGVEGAPHRVESSSSSSSARGHAAQQAQDMRERISDVIVGLGLAHVQDRLVRDNLSGGQRKRVSIGMEVVVKPRILFLDEPSSGLDASTSHRILEMVLSGAASENCTTFATIHQPRWSTLCLFDMLILLSPGGYLCYAGPVSALKAYFVAVLNLEFPKDENPADIIVDACTFDSARQMVVEGIWKSPPQCLRAVLIPTPGEADEEECTEQWQREEFGKILSALWNSFVAIRTQVDDSEGGLAGSPGAAGLEAEGAAQPPRVVPEVEDRLSAAAATRAQMIHWAQQMSTQMARALLVTSRAVFPTISLNACLLMIAMVAMAWAFPNPGLVRIFLKSGLMWMLLCLAQSIAAQRIFGGEERGVASREAAVSSLSQVVSSFIGKDIASLVEIALSALCFTLTYWPLVRMYASAGDIFAIGFGCLYAVWGMNYIWAILFPPNTAMLFAVVTGFLSFLFGGIKPEANFFFKSMGGYGSLLLLASPIRWSFAHWVFRHVNGAGANYLRVAAVKDMAKGNFHGKGFDFEYLACPNYSVGVLERWKMGDGWVCHSGQLFLLGFLFRFLAMTCLLTLSSATASGGQLSLGMSSPMKARMVQDGMVVFLLFFVILGLVLIGHTY